MSNMTIGQRIAELRKQNGLSQEALGEALGVTRQSISKWESGSSTPELEKLLALSECFNITLDELVREEYGSQGPNEPPKKAERAGGSRAVEMKVGICLCLAGAVCLILAGIMMVVSPGAAERLNAASTVTLNGSGVMLVLCVLSMVIGLILILRKR